MISQELLKNLGLSDTEARVYLAAITAGPVLPKHLAENAGVKRPTLYEFLPKLIGQGLLSETSIGKRRYLVAEDPQVFLDKKQADLAQLEQMVPQLRLLLATASSKPKILFYEGVEGVKKIYLDNLREHKPISEFVGIENINSEVENFIKNYYIPNRIKKKIFIKMLISGSSQHGIWNLKSGPHVLREIKNIPKNLFPAPVDCFIYGHSVAFAVFRKDSQPVGVIIRSQEVSAAIQSMFNFVWEKA